MKIQEIRGTHDLYGQELLKFKKLEKIVNNIAALYDFEEIITPIFESTELFKKPLGEHSDVVLKEMYTFSDRNDSSITLRPELTTPILRASISKNFLDKLPKKIYGLGPCFRRERPQKGRYRQFNQINFEILGTQDIFSDVELILLADNILKTLLPNIKIDLHINSLGDKNTLVRFKSELTNFYQKNINNLSIESQNKIIKNPLRILDSKNADDIKINKKAPKISDYYSSESKENFKEIQHLLSESLVNYNLDSSLVRGLDYYCHTVFEFKTKELGSQDTLIGGGRYDGLSKVLGGPDIAGLGWAGGIERMLMLMKNVDSNEKKISLILMDEKFKVYGLKILQKLRESNIKVFFDYKYNLKKSLSKANQNDFDFVIIIGANEYTKQLCTLKDLKNNYQETSNIEEIIKKLI